jgi:hypothetical protein
MTNVIECAFSFSLKTVADRTHVNLKFSAQNDPKSTQLSYVHPVPGHSV